MALEHFRAAMEKHSVERERLADAAEHRLEKELRELTGYEQIAMSLALSDEHVVEGLRVAAWIALGAKDFVPKNWPLHITPEIQWRFNNLEDE
jgi:hypothetical protein